MPFGRIHVFLLVLVFSLNHVRSDDVYSYNDGVDDEADVRVDDQAADAPVDDDAAIADNADFDAVSDDGEVADADAVDDESNIVEADDLQMADTPCSVVGAHFSAGCNVCYCYKPRVQACTNVDCKRLSKKVLSANPAKRQRFNKLRDLATGCVPGEKIKNDRCECSCAIPSVLTCPDDCI